ncbi:MAG: DUF4389 domain-containing protein [Pseudomonadota bacterium]
MNASPSTTDTETQAETFDRRPIWKRGGLMLIFVIAFSIAQVMLNLAAVVQFITMLLTGKPNQFVAEFGRSLAIWLAEVSAFQTGATENKPFPFASWPSAD